MQDALQLKSEILRKSIHIATSVIPLLYFFNIDKQFVLIICTLLATGFLIADILRINFNLARKYFLRIFSALLREDEAEKRLTGATFLFLGMTITLFLFKKEAAVPAVLFLTLADPAAAIAGKVSIGKPLIAGKTWQGSFAFFCIGLVVLVMTLGLTWVSLVILGITVLIELIPIGINDNILIPVVSGALLHLLT